LTAKILVTGSTGFVGRHLCSLLVHQGHEVSGVVRSPSRSAALPMKVNSVTWDLPGPVPSGLLDGIDTVLHLAARVHVMHDRSSTALETYRALNVQPTRRLLLAARESNVRHFVFVSSVKVHGEMNPDVVSADDPLRPADPYAISKAEAEQLIREESGSMSWTIVRPTFVFGAGGAGNFARLIALVRLASRVPLPLGSIRNGRSLVYVENLASLLATCAVDPRAARRVFLAADVESPSTPELMRRLGRALGRSPHLYPFPVPLLRGVAAMIGFGAEAARLTESYRVDASDTSRELGWVAPFSLDDGLWRSTHVSA
jgi:nucleoside-diphosphate-sugar epimerase